MSVRRVRVGVETLGLHQSLVPGRPHIDTILVKLAGHDLAVIDRFVERGCRSPKYPAVLRQ